MRKRVFKISGVVSFVLGIIFLANSFSGMTGFAIVENVNRNVSGIIGLVFVFAGIVLMSLEKKVEDEEKAKNFIIKSFRRRVEKLERRKIGFNEAEKAYSIQAVQDAAIDMAYGPVPLKDAFRFYEECNKKVESGEWVELSISGVTSTKNPKKYPFATAVYRYWGPKEYEGKSQNRLDYLYKHGELGKTHEMTRGSDKYKLGGRLSEDTVSIPPESSRLLHRHWELAPMYKYRKKLK